MDASPFLSGAALGLSISGDGVSIDPATGLVTVSLDALHAGAAIRVAAESSGGRTEFGFRLTVAPAGVAPTLTRAPALTGTGRLGAGLALDPGAWAGEPAPDLALQWLRDGAEIAGAVGDRFTPGAAEDGTAVAARVTARNPAGEMTAETAAVRVTRAAPAATGGLADVVLAQGAPAAVVPAGAAFSGGALRFAVAGGGATIDPATGALTLPTTLRRAAETVTVTATNSGGAARVAFALRVLAAPAVTGAPETAIFAIGAAATVAAGAAFSGDALVFALESGPAGVAVDPASGLATIPTGTALEGVVAVRASNAVGAARVAFAVRVLAAPPAAVTVFDAPEKLAQVSLVQRNAAPSWTHDAAGWAVLSPGRPDDVTHGAWSGGRGDGRYRALVRIGHSAATPAAYTRARPFGLNGRMGRSGADMRGVRVELDRRVDGSTSFEIREYTGAGEATRLILTAPVAWDYNVWYWMETEFDGPAVRARLYPADEAAPAWQATVTTATRGAGYFGPMSTVFNTATFPIVRIQRLEHHPPAVAGAAPRLTGVVADVRASVGETIGVDVGAAVEGGWLAWSVLVDGAPAPAGWAIDSAGVVSVPTAAAFARRSVTVTATDAAGRSVAATFAVEIEPAAPRLTGALADVAASVGDTVRVDFGAIVAGTGLGFSVDRPWTIDAAGVLAVPTAVPLEAAPVALAATDALGRSVAATLRVTVRAPALALSAPVPDVAAILGEARTVDIGALVTPKAGLSWKSNRPAWGLSAAGVLTIPTAAVLAASTVAVTASDAFGQSVTATFQVSVAAAPLTATAAPGLVAAAPPGTATGSVWNIAGGVYAGGLAPIVTERRFLRDGVALGAFGAASAYTIVAADRGRTITAQVRRTDSSVPPQTLTVAVAGAAVIPAAAALVPDFTVSTTAQLLAAMVTAAGQAGPKVIACNPGDYAALTRTGALVKAGKAADGSNLANRVTVISADRARPATWRDTSWSLQKLDGFTFDGLRFLGATDDGLGFAILGRQAVNCKDLANVTFRNCAWDGWCDNLAITRSVNLTIEWNDMKGAGRDSCRLFDRHQNLLVQHNDFDGFRADGSPGVDYTRASSDDPNRHPDFLSIQTTTVSARGGINVQIQNNRFRGGNGYHQGIFVQNGQISSGNADFDTYKTTGLTIQGNWIETCHVNALYIDGCENFVCRDNLIRRIASPGGGYWTADGRVEPTLILAGLSTGTIADVVSHRAIKRDGRMPNLDGVAITNYVVDARGAARPAGLPVPPRVGAYGYE